MEMMIEQIDVRVPGGLEGTHRKLPLMQRALVDQFITNQQEMPSFRAAIAYGYGLKFPAGFCPHVESGGLCGWRRKETSSVVLWEAFSSDCVHTH